MRKNNRRNNAKKERSIMVASSAFVLTALTLTGIYMKSNNEKQQDDGYTIDFTTLENDMENKFQEIAKNSQKSGQTENNLYIGDNSDTDSLLDMELPDILGYVEEPEPGRLEVGSGLVEIPGLTDGNVQDQISLPGDVLLPQEPAVEPEPEAEPEKKTPVSGGAVAKTLHFAEDMGLRRPVNGETLLPFSMDGSIYFSTLDHYKYNPAMMIASEAGSPVTACADGKVVNIFEDAEIGHAVTMELGDGYRLTYGQLENISVSTGSYVTEGEVIGSVAAPTKYFCVEGSNLYLELMVDDTPVNPEPLFR